MPHTIASAWLIEFIAHAIGAACTGAALMLGRLTRLYDAGEHFLVVGGHLSARSYLAHAYLAHAVLAIPRALLSFTQLVCAASDCCERLSARVAADGQCPHARARPRTTSNGVGRVTLARWAIRASLARSAAAPTAGSTACICSRGDASTGAPAPSRRLVLFWCAGHPRRPHTQ